MWFILVLRLPCGYEFPFPFSFQFIWFWVLPFIASFGSPVIWLLCLLSSFFPFPPFFFYYPYFCLTFSHHFNAISRLFPFFVISFLPSFTSLAHITCQSPVFLAIFRCPRPSRLFKLCFHDFDSLTSGLCLPQVCIPLPLPHIWCYISVSTYCPLWSSVIYI